MAAWRLGVEPRVCPSASNGSLGPIDHTLPCGNHSRFVAFVEDLHCIAKLHKVGGGVAIIPTASLCGRWPAEETVDRTFLLPPRKKEKKRKEEVRHLNVNDAIIVTTKKYLRGLFGWHYVVKMSVRDWNDPIASMSFSPLLRARLAGLKEVSYPLDRCWLRGENNCPL